jgi:hypothetical protein
MPKFDKATVKGLEKFLKSIEGARLTSVQFIMDYVILGFDEKGALTILVWPEIIFVEKVLKYKAVGYRDGLCELITEIVQEIGVNAEEETISILFKNGIRLLIRLNERNLGERIIFTAPKHILYAC